MGYVKVASFHSLASLFKGRWRGRMGATVGYMGTTADLYLTPFYSPFIKRGTRIGV